MLLVLTLDLRLCGSAEPYFALFNPDAIATRDWLKKLVEFMDENSDTGMVQSLLLSLVVSMIRLVASLIGLVTRLSSSFKVNYELLRRVKPYEVGYAKGGRF